MTGEVEREMYLIVTIDFYISIKIDNESYFLYFATHDPLCNVATVTEWLWKTQLSRNNKNLTL